MKDNSYLCACQTNKGAYVSRSNYSIQYSGYLHCRMSLAVVGYRWALRGFHRGDFLSLKESLMYTKIKYRQASQLTGNLNYK